jgi:hypothetical protein
MSIGVIRTSGVSRITLNYGAADHLQGRDGTTTKISVRRADSSVQHIYVRVCPSPGRTVVIVQATFVIEAVKAPWWSAASLFLKK